MATTKNKEMSAPITTKTTVARAIAAGPLARRVRTFPVPKAQSKRAAGGGIPRSSALIAWLAPSLPGRRHESAAGGGSELVFAIGVSGDVSSLMAMQDPYP